ncbi:unnamed protein product [Arabis nemorensis]|uniref:Uncharacterized protein n=1 Tax=Arabis nemorensis TaxID=586526 RepID=A0A565CGX0_9BRAS|nr:unnamed protein product [Arabis nemorensis]
MELTFEQRKRSASNTVGRIVYERIILLCNILVRRYFVLTASDLEECYQNPESFRHEQDMIQWTQKLRPCA